ncbi:MAG: histidine phosphatase family protein [Chitinivibrionales bacterium]|nr:histidine phosphatase family protein [Chitinivibrionales bacterium]
MNTRILGVRHGETKWNKAGIQQGHLNRDLTDAGVSQAKALAQGLKAYEFDALYSSDLGLAVGTAEEISKVIGKEFKREERLRERNLGLMQGLSKDEFADKYPEEWKRFQSGDPEYRLPDGESSMDRYVRAIECIEELVEKNKGKTFLIVSHGGIVMSLFYKALKIPIEKYGNESIMKSYKSDTDTGAVHLFNIWTWQVRSITLLWYFYSMRTPIQ